MHRRITLMCHCEERSDVAISGRHCRPVPAADKRYAPKYGVQRRSLRKTAGREKNVAALTERLADWQVIGRHRRTHTPCRGADSRARHCTCEINRLSLKW